VPKATQPMQNPALSHSRLSIVRAPGAAPNSVRYTVTAPDGLLGHVELRQDRDSEDVEWFIRTYLQDHPSRLVRAIGSCSR
jgi:hypothetical protein